MLKLCDNKLDPDLKKKFISYMPYIIVLFFLFYFRLRGAELLPQNLNNKIINNKTLIYMSA